MDKNRLAGAGRQARGSLNKAIGKITGDRETEVEGAKVKGRERNDCHSHAVSTQWRAHRAAIHPFEEGQP